LNAAARTRSLPLIRPLAGLRRALRCAYLRWRIEHAEDDVIACGQLIEHARRQQQAYRFAAQALRCDLAATESEAP
jgi:hypothetical protein